MSDFLKNNKKLMTLLKKISLHIIFHSISDCINAFIQKPEKMLNTQTESNSSHQYQKNKFKRPQKTRNYHKKNVILINIWLSYFIVVLSVIDYVSGSLPRDDPNLVKINKCCEKFEIIVDNRCTDARELNATTWKPTFTGFDGSENLKVDNYKFIVGKPDCGSMQLWDVYNDPVVRHLDYP